MIEHPKGMTFMGSRSLPDYAGARVDGLKVQLSAFCLDKTEVTASAYETCVAEGACERAATDVRYGGVTDAQKSVFSKLCNGRKPDRGDHPINCVTFTMATAYCGWKGMRLPTEAEWEYAARGKGQNEYPWGLEPPDSTRLNAAGSEYLKWAEAESLPTPKAMYPAEDDGFAGTAPVGQFPKGASSFGVVDLAGNVWEWVGDWFGPYSPGEVSDPRGPSTGTERVVRGGAFNGADPAWANPAWRYKMAPESYTHAVGFRCAKGVDG
jgi:formylglycine-generating enzyme required for sulfatase activity